MKKMFDMVDAVYKATPNPPILIRDNKGHIKLKGQCPSCSTVSVQILDSNYCYHCGQRLR